MEAHFLPGDLLALWQQRADYPHQFGHPNSARLWRTAAVELERARWLSHPGLSAFHREPQSGFQPVTQVEVKRHT